MSSLDTATRAFNSVKNPTIAQKFRERFKKLSENNNLGNRKDSFAIIRDNSTTSTQSVKKTTGYTIQDTKKYFVGYQDEEVGSSYFYQADENAGKNVFYYA